MQKLLKTKPNYKKFLTEKDQFQKYDYKHSQTLSTNESKIHLEYEKQCLTNFPFVETQSVLHKNLSKYGTSHDLYYLTNFEAMYSQNRSRQKIFLQDLCNFKDEQLMEQSYKSQKSMEELTQLFEYYKYYINNPILFCKEHFKTLYNFYEKKKYLQYKKLKAVLDLDDDNGQLSDNSMNQNISVDAKRSTKENTKTFYIMNLIQTDLSDKNNQSESKAFLELNHNLEQILGRSNNPHTNTPQKTNHADLSDKNSTLFKKKKQTPSQISSFKNTILKKTKKLSFNNSASSLKQIKFIKTAKEPYLSKFNIDTIQFPTMKAKAQISYKKFRHGSNLSMGELQGKSNNFSIQSPKKYHKKRLNSCETVISKNDSKGKPTNEKKNKGKTPIQSKFKQQRSDIAELEEFKNYLKKVSGNFRRNTEKAAERGTEKGTESGFSSQSSKFRRENSPLKIQANILIKKLKKKAPAKNSSGKNSLQKSPHKSSRKQQCLIEQSIMNLKKKIRLAKESIKCTTSNSVSNLHTQKSKKY